MRLALVTRHARPIFIPLALQYLKASVAYRTAVPADRIDILEFDPAAGTAEIARALLAKNPDVIGLSCYIWNAKTLIDAARIVKAQRPWVRIVLGGPEVGPVAAGILARHPFVDVVVLSEGEMPLADLVRAWDAGGPIDAVSGICFRRGDAVVDTGPAPLVTDLEAYPSPHRLGYVSYDGRVACIETQRGCVFHCNFCFYNKDYSLRNRRFDLDRVKDELRFVLEQDVHTVYMMDPIFNLNAARAKELCRFIAAHNRRRHPLHAEIWAEFVDDELAGLMRAANFQVLEVGLQSVEQDVLAMTERRLRLERFEEGLRHLQRHKLPFNLQLIYGLPGETRDSFRRALNYAMTLDPPKLQVFHLLVLPGTQLWRKASELQLAFSPEPPYRACAHLSMTKDDFEYGAQLEAACTILQGSRTFRLLSKEPGMTFADLVDEWIEWCPDGDIELSYTHEMPRFVEHLCARRRIDATFYRQFGKFEFVEREGNPPPAERRQVAGRA
jgi:radical SAM superfamily enzyme YgiQ (UPF0313 family)